MIHGGDPSASGGLRPTHGCVRLANADLKSLLDAITMLQLTEAPPDSCSMTNVIDVQIPASPTIDLSAGPDDDETDPPPAPDPGPNPLP